MKYVQNHVSRNEGGAIFTPTVSQAIWTTNKQFVRSINVFKTPTGKYKIRKINRQTKIYSSFISTRNEKFSSVLDFRHPGAIGIISKNCFLPKS